ncbi:hypothetical protein ROBYS_24710 [Roseobacter sp. OBYS 0001]|nr:hypothetical protein ROBYS_24710 [Roseobacter sp. OBYS 0001]
MQVPCHCWAGRDGGKRRMGRSEYTTDCIGCSTVIQQIRWSRFLRVCVNREFIAKQITFAFA